MKNGKVLSLLFSIGFFALWLGIFMGNKDNIARYDITYTRIFFVIIIILIIITGIIRINKTNKFLHYEKSIFVLFIIVVFAIQLFIMFNIYQQIGWDVDVVLEYAYNIANKPLDNIDLTHLEIYPNLSFMITTYSFVFRVFSFLPFIYQYYIFAMISIIFVDISLLLAYKISKLVFNQRVALIYAILFTLFFVFSPWIVVPYSDTISMPFPLLLFYIYLKSEEYSKFKKYVFYILLGIVAAIGYLIKPQVIIVCIAIIIILTFRAITEFKKCYRNLILVVLLLAIMFSFNKTYTSVINRMYDHRIQTEKNITFTHYLMMGLNERKGLYGAWYDKDFNYSMSFDSKKEREEGNLLIVKQRLENFGVTGYSHFLWKKANWVLGDATFFWMCEGSGFTKDLSYNGTSTQKFIRSFLYLDAPNFKIYGSYLTGIWMIINLFMLFPYQDKKAMFNFAIIKLSIVGIVMFTLMFEGRSRYLINYIPFFIMAASAGIFRFQSFIHKLLPKSSVESKIGESL